MKTVHCDICGKEIENNSSTTDIWNKDMFVDIDDNPFEDVCEECFKVILCCINMMKETKWRPDFHEVLKSGDIWERDVAGYALCNIENKFNVEF